MHGARGTAKGDPGLPSAAPRSRFPLTQCLSHAGGWGSSSVDWVVSGTRNGGYAEARWTLTQPARFMIVLGINFRLGS